MQLNNNLIPFIYEGSEVRTIKGEDGKPWFCLSDVCKILQYKDPSRIASTGFDPEGTQKLRTLTKRGMQELVFISEPNLYRLAIRSNLPAARKFEKWVFEELIPAAIREIKKALNCDTVPQNDTVTIHVDINKYVALLEKTNALLENELSNRPARKKSNPKKATPEELETIHRHWNTGITAAEIGRLIGRKASFVIYHAPKGGSNV